MSESLAGEESFEVSAQDGTNPELDSNDGAEDPNEQYTEGDTLIDRGLQDPLDEGYSPPDYEPKTKIPTEAEEHEGLSLDELLAAEEPDVVVVAERDDLSEVEALELGDERAGRLVDVGDDGFADTEKDLIAEDDGFAGGAASAEEAAMHIFDPEGSDRA
ncbi:MAG: DUF5709 domain-containing protein [Nakamurella sp.]